MLQTQEKTTKATLPQETKRRHGKLKSSPWRLSMAAISTGIGTVAGERVGVLLVARGGTKDGEEHEGKMQDGAET